MNGQGKYKYFNGDVYEGNFENGIKYGDGIMSYENGDKYLGEWKEGRKHGKGKMSYKNGNAFDGKWYKDKRDGFGKLTNSEGVVIEEGEYDDDTLPISINNIDSVLGKVNLKYEQVINSTNGKKFQELLTSAKQYVGDCGKETVFSYVAGFTVICSALNVYIFGPQSCFSHYDEYTNTVTGLTSKIAIYSSKYLFCSMFGEAMGAVRSNIGLIFNPIRDFLVNNHWVGYVIAAGFAAFIILLIYALYTFINMSDNNYGKMKQDLRSKNRRSTRKK